MTHISASDKCLGMGRSLPSVRKVLESTWHTLLLWQRRHSGRRALCDLDDRSLKDIGLTRADVARLAAAPFWRASDHVGGLYGR